MGRWLSEKEREERDKEVVRLSKLGLSQKQIGTRLSMHSSHVYLVLKKVSKQTAGRRY